MRVEKLYMDDLRYNPELSAFEAIVTISEAGERFAYPVHKLAPLHADYALIAKGLTEKAMQAHRHAPARDLRLRRATVPAEPAHTTQLTLIETPELRRIGAALAA